MKDSYCKQANSGDNAFMHSMAYAIERAEE